MARVIPLIPHEQWQQAICSRCVKPGHCCTRFNLSGMSPKGINEPTTFWDDDELGPFLSEGNAMFRPLERWGQWTVESSPDTGRTYSAWLWRCAALGKDGRCTIYEHRPALCRSYEPLSDGLCAMKPEGEGDGRQALELLDQQRRPGP